MHRKDVFISHWPDDEAVAEAACGALEEAGLGCWFAPRDDWPIGYDAADRSSRDALLGHAVDPLGRFLLFGQSLCRGAGRRESAGLRSWPCASPSPRSGPASELTLPNWRDERYRRVDPRSGGRPRLSRRPRRADRWRGTGSRRERPSPGDPLGRPAGMGRRFPPSCWPCSSILAAIVSALIWIVP